MIGSTANNPESLIAQLESLVDGAAAEERLIAMGPNAIPRLEHLLLESRPRTISLPRCRAAHALGELGAKEALIEYFRGYKRPEDAAVLFAEDAVRTAVAQELARWKSDEIYRTLLEAAQDRLTGGLIRALAEFGKERSIPVFFAALEDDLCRADSIGALRTMCRPARAYAVLSLRDEAGPAVYFSSARRRRRATLQLLREFGAGAEEWREIRPFLDEQDEDSVIAVAAIGFAIAPESEYATLIGALFRIARHLNWAQEDEVTRLLDEHAELARKPARDLADEAAVHGESPDWLAPRWRILRHLLGDIWSHAPSVAPGS
jgi:hypothetical protein